MPSGTMNVAPPMSAKHAKCSSGSSNSASRRSISAPPMTHTDVDRFTDTPAALRRRAAHDRDDPAAHLPPPGVAHHRLGRHRRGWARRGGQVGHDRVELHRSGRRPDHPGAVGELVEREQALARGRLESFDDALGARRPAILTGFDGRRWAGSFAAARLVARIGHIGHLHSMPEAVTPRTTAGPGGVPRSCDRVACASGARRAWPDAGASPSAGGNTA